ncbi:filamentation induced by cAMP protein Fic [Solidesulfovibrio fructosivorans JJ]]|uniref:Filamentation induced by cAMP protein Fic n=1 Tax=Solidesulfovibrio fructosivorans JJ] TaxID=596151 RepID=E1JXE9_SOLFR|nr:Fic family protein [Solidesulfovibrio fructosivorans]EFL50926.1 filamentation induced by cAMP protein Fic [Solidesulfovibrio fructosivorans JJ]]
MKPEAFTEQAAGRVIRVGQGEVAYHAFVPAPLPPALTLDPDLILTLSDADRALGELAGLGRAIANPSLLVRPFMRQEAVLSSRIEGTQADLADLYGYEAGQLLLPGVRPRKQASDVREVFNYVQAMEYGLERLETLPLSQRLIREVHARLMDGVRGDTATPGEFRRSQNWIGPPGCLLAQASYVPPPVPEMAEALDALEKYLHEGSAYPPLVRLACIHYQFEAIHPFIDGNGRVGRLLVPLLMVSWGLLPHPLLYLSVYFERRREDYYRLLMAVSTHGDWRAWTSFFLQGVAAQARDAVARAKRLQDLQADWRDALQRKRASALVLRLADALFERPILTIPVAAEVLSTSYPSAKAAVAKLEAIGALRQVAAEGTAKTYEAARILDIVTGEDESEDAMQIKEIGQKL